MARLSWWVFSPYSDWNVARRGRDDGLAEPPIPPWESEELPPFLREMKDLGDSSVLAISRAWARRDEDLEPRVRNALQRERDTAEQLDDARKDYEDARQHYYNVHKRWPPYRAFAAFRIYWVLIGILILGEFPMNMFVFRVFGENEAFNALVALVLGVVLVGCAHLLGDELRRGATRSQKAIVFTVVLIVVPVALLACVAWLRQQYLSELSGIASGMSPNALLLLFFMFNLGIYVLAAAASHDVADEPFRRLYKATIYLSRVEQAHAAAERAVARWRAIRHQTWQRHRNLALEVQDAVERSSSIYWRENYSARSDRGNQKTAYPAAYGKVPKLDIPANLQEYQEIALTREGEQANAG